GRCFIGLDDAHRNCASVGQEECLGNDERGVIATSRTKGLLRLPRTNKGENTRPRVVAHFRIEEVPRVSLFHGRALGLAFPRWPSLILADEIKAYRGSDHVRFVQEVVVIDVARFEKVAKRQTGVIVAQVKNRHTRPPERASTRPTLTFAGYGRIT